VKDLYVHLPLIVLLAGDHSSVILNAVKDLNDDLPTIILLGGDIAVPLPGEWIKVRGILIF
jgi:hypothetical protein